MQPPVSRRDISTRNNILLLCLVLLEARHRWTSIFWPPWPSMSADTEKLQFSGNRFTDFSFTILNAYVVVKKLGTGMCCLLMEYRYLTPWMSLFSNLPRCRKATLKNQYWTFLRVPICGLLQNSPAPPHSPNRAGWGRRDTFEFLLRKLQTRREGSCPQKNDTCQKVKTLVMCDILALL